MHHRRIAIGHFAMRDARRFIVGTFSEVALLRFAFFPILAFEIFHDLPARLVTERKRLSSLSRSHALESVGRDGFVVTGSGGEKLDREQRGMRFANLCTLSVPS